MSAASRAETRFLHLHSTFGSGGKERRAVRLMNAFGPKIAHSIVSGVPGERGAARELSRAVAVDWPDDFPPLTGAPKPGRLKRIAEAMRGYDLVLTYNWGAMDAVMAHTLFGEAFGLPPLVHHEDGFNADEQVRLKPSRNWYRRIALGRASRLVVPSETLEGIALTTWSQPIGRVVRIPNGIDTPAFARPPKADAIPGLVKHPGEFWVGTLARLSPVKDLPALVRACAGLHPSWHLVIVGEGPERDAIRAEAVRAGIEDRVHLPGFAPDPAHYAGLFDIFALASRSEQFPISLVEAMAAGLPAAATGVGDIAAIVAEENAPFVVPAGDEVALGEALARLAYDPALRSAVGHANRTKARAEFDEKTMIAAYRRLYSAVMGGAHPI
ncbi:glycosyltransferase [Tsuneonella amylolytica]|uniref:glycosyltransferase n=1 Tax=Tsuneonella amylolytica TaxID=2338327 RepID=UPI000EAA33B7|nr:glycosyltransferase [Tsuneonella amylolytica]